MKKKFLIIILCAVSLVAGLIGLSACNLFDKEEGEKHVHTIAHSEAKAASCSAEGSKEYWYCTECGDYFADEKGENRVQKESFKIEKLPHTEITDKAVPKTCTTDGLTEGKHCAVCKEVLVPQEVVKAGHIDVVIPAVPATCTTDGLTEGKYCWVCKAVTLEQQVVPAAHTIVDGVEVPATCTTDGLTAGRHCKNCDYIEVQPTVIPAKGHKEVDDAAVPATCTEDGKTAGKHCETCGAVTVQPTVIPAKGHSLTHNEAAAADCVHEGNKEYWRCSACSKNFDSAQGENELLSVTVPKKVHNYTEKYICTLCGSGTATAGLLYKYNSDTDTYTVTGIGSASGDIVIPHYYDGKLVTEIGNDAFHACGEYFGGTKFTSVVLPDSVVRIGNQGFCECTDLKSITFGKGLSEIGFNAFGFDLSLEEIKVAEGNTVYRSAGNCLIETAGKKIILGCGKSVIPTDGSVNTIGERAFSNAKFTGNFVIPANITSIEDLAFSSCTGMKAITLPEGVSMGEYVFSSNDLKEITVPENVKAISRATLADSYGLERVYYYGTKTKWDELTGGYTTTEYDVYCMGGLQYSLNETTDTFTVIGIGEASGNIAIPTYHEGKLVTAIGDDAFHGCSGYWGGGNLTKLVVPGNVVSIGNQAICECTDLESVIICEGVTNLGYNLFGACTNLKTVSVPDSLITVEGMLFGSCSALQYNEYDGGLYIGNENNPYVMLVSVKDKDITSFKVHKETKILCEAFQDCGELVSVTFPEHLTSIGAYAFYNCKKLTGLTIPDGVKMIGSNAFEYCSSLTGELAIPKSVKTVRNDAFVGCSGFTSLVIPDNVTSIGYAAFNSCIGLTSIEVQTGNPNYYSENNCLIEKENKALIQGCNTSIIPNDVKSIGGGAFRGCSELTGALVIPQGVTSISTWAFSGCSGFTSLSIPDSVTFIGMDAFYGCSGLTGEVRIPDSVTEIWGDVFFGCENITSVVIGNGITKIREWMFMNCSSLQSVTIPKSVKSIDRFAFTNCTSLTSITFTGTQSEWYSISKNASWNENTGSYTITYLG